MKLIPIIAAAASIFAASSAYSFTLDFEGATSFGFVENFYNGGTDSEGASGINYGASFSSSGISLIDDGTLEFGFSNQPSGATVLANDGTSVVLNVASGFTGQVLFFYSSRTDPVSEALLTTVTVFDGLDGTGNIVGSASFSPNSNTNPGFNTWNLSAVGVIGTGKSVSFGANGGFIAYDDITITAVPEPTTALLLALGVAGLALNARRQHKG